MTRVLLLVAIVAAAMLLGIAAAHWLVSTAFAQPAPRPNPEPELFSCHDRDSFVRSWWRDFGEAQDWIGVAITRGPLAWSTLERWVNHEKGSWTITWTDRDATDKVCVLIFGLGGKSVPYIPEEPS